MLAASKLGVFARAHLGQGRGASNSFSNATPEILFMPRAPYILLLISMAKFLETSVNEWCYIFRICIQIEFFR